MFCEDCFTTDHTVDVRVVEHKGKIQRRILCDTCFNETEVMDHVLFRPDLETQISACRDGEALTKGMIIA